MRIEKFWAKGFRSLRHVELADLGPFNILYGKNGSGKSNILAAMRLLIEMLRAQACLHEAGEWCGVASQALKQSGHDARHELHARDEARTIVVGARLASDEHDRPGLVSGPIRFGDLTVEIKIEWILEANPKVFMTRLESGGQDVRTTLPKDQKPYLATLLSEVIPAQAYTLVGADRFWGEPPAFSAEADDQRAWHMQKGGLAQQLLDAHIDSRPAVRKRLDGLRALLEGPPLHRPRFVPVKDAKTGRAVLQELLPEPNPDGLEIPIDFAGLGIAQIYVILAQAMLSNSRVVAIEEPEAHLHAPTTGLHLRELLRRLVNDRHIDQLFIATHSNLFDLDDTGFWEVRFENGETLVAKRPLDEIDRHLYEPGPTLHAFEELLKLSDPDRVMFRRADGTPVTAREMLSLLYAADPVALEYLTDLHRAAVDVVGLRARRKAGS